MIDATKSDGPPEKHGGRVHTLDPAPHESPDSHHTNDTLASEFSRLTIVSARSVSWWHVHEYVAPVLERTGSWPMAGSPEWCALPVDSPAKIAALFDAARHHALRVEIAQEARAQASKDVAEAADWSSVTQCMLQRSGTYIPRVAS